MLPPQEVSAHSTIPKPLKPQSPVTSSRHGAESVVKVLMFSVVTGGATTARVKQAGMEFAVSAQKPSAVVL